MITQGLVKKHQGTFLFYFNCFIVDMNEAEEL